MITAERLERTTRQDRSERPAVDAGAAQLTPVGAARAEGAERVVEDAHANPGARPLGPRRRKAAAGVVVVNEVILEVNRALGAHDHLQHRNKRGCADLDVTHDFAWALTRTSSVNKSTRKN